MRVPLYFLIVAVLCVQTVYSGVKPAGKIDYLSLSAGTWMAFKDESQAQSKDSYFQSVKVSAYYHVGIIKGAVSIPLAVTLERYSDRLTYAVYPGDGEFTFGVSFKRFSPRLGVLLPMGYPERGTAWIGSGNIRALAAGSFNFGTFFDKQVSAGADAAVRVCLTDTADGARMGRGSTSGYLSLKVSLIRGAMQYGVESFTSAGIDTYSDWGDQEQSMASLLIVSAQRTLAGSVSLGIRGGAGAGQSSVTPGVWRTQATAGLSLGWGL